MCHAQPTLGGSSPGAYSWQIRNRIRRLHWATLDGAHNSVPSFITANGPVRSVLLRNSNGSADGGVHGLYTITGLIYAQAAILRSRTLRRRSRIDIIFRIPTRMFGMGLVEDTPDATLRANLAHEGSSRRWELAEC